MRWEGSKVLLYVTGAGRDVNCAIEVELVESVPSSKALLDLCNESVAREPQVL
jgi:hypothetical protein